MTLILFQKSAPFITLATLRKTLLCSLCLVINVGSIYPYSAHAQSVDYANLQELFGEPVTTSATGKPQKASEAPVALEIITADQIRRQGVTSLPEILNHVPGLTSWQASRSFADVGVRGQNIQYNPTLMVLLNGRQVYIDVYGYTDWSLIPVQLEEIRQIEIVKGPTTALYGFNAVSGVVNIVTYNPQYDNVAEAGVSVGTGNYKRAYGYKTIKLSEKVSVRVSGSADGMDEFSLHSKTSFIPASTFQDITNNKLMADGLVQLTDKTQLRIEGSFANSSGTEPTASPTAAIADKIMWAGKTSLTSDTAFGMVEANLYQNNYQNTYGGFLAGSEVENQITVAQLQDLFKIGTAHTLRIQGEYRHNMIKSPLFIGDGAEISYDVLASGGMWNWAITPDVEWTNALRLDHLMLKRSGPLATAIPYTNNDEFDQEFNTISINSGIVWKATTLDTLRTSYGRGVQVPSLIQFGIQDPHLLAGTIFVGSPELKPVIVQNYEIGYDRLIGGIGGKFRSSLFYKITEDINDFSANNYLTPNGTFVTQAGIIGDSTTAGVELGLDGTIGSNWSWGESYLYQNTVDDPTAVAAQIPTLVAAQFEDTVPHHVFKAHLGYITDAWETDVFGELGSSFRAWQSVPGGYNYVNLDGYYTLGGRVGYTFPNNITVALLGSDITQNRVSNNYGLENERRLFLTLSKKF